MSATLADVARRAGVSEATASRVLNGRRHVSAGARSRVETAALELDYVPNRAARDLSLARSSTVAFLVHHSQYPPRAESSFAARVLHGVASTLRARGFDLLYGTLDEAEANDLARLPTLRRSRADAVLLLGPAFPAAAVATLVEEGRIVVLVDNLLPDRPVDAVLADNRQAASAITAHLVDAHGYRTLACIAGPAHWPSTAERIAGAVDALETAGLEPRIIHVEETTVRHGVEAIGRLGTELPEAIVAVNDAMAIGALHRLRTASPYTPVAVVGFDDSPWAQLADPPLTTVAIDAEAMGSLAAERLVALLNGRDSTEPQVSRIPTALRIRRSCGCTGDEERIEIPMEDGASTPQRSVTRPSGGTTAGDAWSVARGEVHDAN